ncbi:DEHA2D16368p [Debaryomyces hansenii CBS767]|uniref:Nucleolar protein 9 n=1 Tax=Debaryomyces hansenii (strain ATCC 36239 / CBS 767 / BCRC 21394 / JCM 1990 / NBRC 0083 / IGC 2968) TaxID=284592 RepID=NOP9_DEBHA|nr:DEHA2D16368p [Debaryomyces hansenii CBS767]Q6BRH3.2 RecName: Full=Nucleolar protein 9; AltName: Full=Pumilio domain-containing protein NOP9 [Debaryomyces hansenii CBS767]CAG87368.2 DEHA2D16368p [Debaryomyces hansenii CBS767]|eukprot:XP_459197.2 DEHA2D16368p [Debaryomyces hansenii CBS767]
MVQPKVRGRRAEKKSKEVNTQPEDYSPNDRSELEENDDKVESNPALKTTFFGLVDSNEIDYFKQAESTLNVNAFDNDEEREGFIRSVLEEARGKELKLVTNQICSKLMERLVLFATDRQLKNIFRQFSGHFVALAHHKYSSHVLETLLVRAAALIEKELVNDFKQDEGEVDDEISQDNDREDEAVVSMETLFVKMLDEFNPHLKTMVDHQYSSHVLRLLILIIAGKELPSTTTSNSTLRSKKSKIARKMIEIKDNDDFNRSFQTPPSFKDQLRKLCNSLGSKGDMKHMRELAINKVASPVLQLLIQVEGIVDKERTFWHLIFLSENSDKNPQEEAFVEYLLSDSVGSHFLESVIRNGGARMKYIERLYKLYMKDRVLKLSKRSTTGVFIIQALLFKLKPAEVLFILDQIIPELASLISIDENQNLELGKNIIDASISRDNYRREELIEQLFVKFAPNYDRHNPSADTSSEFLENTLHLTGSTLGNTRDDWPTAQERRRSLFLEKLMEYDHSFVVCTWLNFLALPIARFIQMCYHGVFSHVVENSLVVIPASEGEPKSVLIIRKRFLNLFQNEIVNLACNSYGSHIVDRLWNFTVLLNMYKDRIGSELASESHKVKESTYGRLVWKNWSMELFVRKKFDWKSLVKNQEEEYFGVGSHEGQNSTERVKKPIELKFEQMMKEKQMKEERAQKAEEGFNKRKNNEFEYGYDNDNKKAKIRGRNR